MQRTWWWAVQKAESKRKHFSVSTVGSPTKPLVITKKARELGYKTMNEQDCENWANQMKSHLINMVDNRPYVFRNTKREIAEAYLASQKQFMGMSENDLQALEHRLAIPLPIIFKAYLKVMGRQHGRLFAGSDSDPDEFFDYRIWAEEIFQEEQRSSCLIPNSVIFLFHQGFAFRYFDVISSHEDTPVLKYIHGSYIQMSEPVIEANSFKEFIETQVSMLEKLDNNNREKGGYYFTITDKGTYQEHKTVFPEINDEKPLIIGDHFID